MIMDRPKINSYLVPSYTHLEKPRGPGSQKLSNPSKALRFVSLDDPLTPPG